MTAARRKLDWEWVERVGVVLLLLAALFPRVRDLDGPFDREFEGFQGAFFTFCALNYERVGFERDGGYPVLGVDLSQDPESRGYIYPNHPPFVPMLTWLGLKAFGPEGWNTNWEQELPPEGAETAARLPFLLLHMAGLFGLWWALRQATGAQEAMLGLAIVAVLPVSALYGTLVNYETPSIAILPFVCGFHARFLRADSRRNLIGLGVSFFLACTVTFAPLFFVPPLVLQTLLARGWRTALRQGLVFGAAAGVPMVAHGLWVRRVLPDVASESVLTRAKHLIDPLFDGTAPFLEWISRQWIRMDHFLTTPILLAACAGIGIEIWLAVRSRGRLAEGEEPRVSLTLPLALGGFLTLFFFYRHTFDGDGALNGQTTFLLNVAPAAAAAVAAVLQLAARPLLRLRAGIAPLVVLVSLVGMPAVARTNQQRYEWREPGPGDDPELTDGPPTPLPISAGRELAEIIPPGAVGLYPRCLGFTPAHDYYAWRTLVPFEDELSWGAALAVIQHSGLSDLPRYVVLPRDPSDSCRAQVDLIRRRLAGFERVAVTERWELWPPFVR